MLNNNVLRNSDFLTSAFPANTAMPCRGIRPENAQRQQRTVRAYVPVGFNGLELGSEGPLTKKHRSSYLFNYRFSVMDFVTLLGVDFGTTGVPHYQDLSFKFNFPVHKVLSPFSVSAASAVWPCSTARPMIRVCIPTRDRICITALRWPPPAFRGCVPDTKTYTKVIFSVLTRQAERRSTPSTPKKRHAIL